MLNPIRLPLMILRRYANKLWVRVSLYAALALAVTAVSPAIAPLIGSGIADTITPDAVMPVLTILATSMLAVSTFSLNVMVSAHRAAAENATPRVHRLLLTNRTTQSVLATFIGSFIFALTAILLFQSGIYADNAAVVVMVLTAVVVVMVIGALVRWIGHLETLGSIENALGTTAAEAKAGLDRLAGSPALGATPLDDKTVLPLELTPVPAPKSGYVQLVDVDGLDACLPATGFMYVARGPGSHVLAGTPLAHASGPVDSRVRERLARCFVIGPDRSFEQDPEYGLIVMSEIASRALSPGINDPGTAIAVIARLTGLLWDHGRRSGSPKTPRISRVFVPVPGPDRLIDAAFGAVARDGAGTVEVAVELHQALHRLAEGPDDALARAAAAMADHVHDHARAALTLDADLDRLGPREMPVQAPSSGSPS